MTGAHVAPSMRKASGASPSYLLCGLASCPINNLAFVIQSEAKESLCEIVASLKLLPMTMYKSIRHMLLDR